MRVGICVGTNAVLDGSGASAVKRPLKEVKLLGIKSGEGECPFFLQGPFSEPTIRSAEHELPLTNP
jgi:hypothetical protein